MTRRQTDSLGVVLTVLTLLALPGCDAVPAPGVLGASAALADARAPCPAGTHARLVDPELGATEAGCEPDSTCDAMDCGAGACREEGGVAACWCPIGLEGDACERCADGYADDGRGGCEAVGASPQAGDGLSLSMEPEPVAASSVDGHRVEFGTCGSDAGCADEIPMTGRVSELFEEVDIAAAQFIKTRCAGSGVVAISRNGRRVYKRGFGKLSGAAAPDLDHCPGDDGNYHPAALNTLPDTPHQVGSVSKFVVAAVVRAQIQRRIEERGLTGRYADPTEALLLDPDLELLPASLLRYLDQSRADAVCPPAPQPGMCVRDGCGGNGPDVRWQQITVGDLLGHTAGLASSIFPDWDDAVVQAAITRDYDSRSDWQADHDDLRARTKFPNALDAARANVAGKLGVDTDDVMFISNYNALDDEDIYDETLKLVAGGCLSHTPVGQTQSNPSNIDQGYHNSSYRMLGRISAHLSGEFGDDARYSAPNGFPELHEGSALDSFLLEHGLEDGVIAEHSIETRVMGWDPSYPDRAPERRHWRNGTYSSTAPAENRPFCVWNGSSCDFTPWQADTNNAIGLRLPWNFATQYIDWDASPPALVSSPPSVPAYQGTASRGTATGGLAVEAPALLRIANSYRAEAESVRQGWRRDACAAAPAIPGDAGSQCQNSSLKSGSMDGARGRVLQLGGESVTRNLPARDSNGHLTMEPNPANWTSVSVNRPDGVDLVTSVHQRRDESGFDGYNFHRYLDYALSRVDWDAVDLELASESRRVVGMAMNASSRTYTWYADDHREVHEGVPSTPGEQATSPSDVSLPSSRISTDIVGVAISTSGNTYAWYDDGHRSRGSSWNLDSGSDTISYTLPPGQTYEDIVAIAISGQNRVYSWYRDGTRAIGRTYDLDAYGVGTYSLPPGQTADEIVGVAIDWAGDNHVYTRFRDGSVSEGSSWNLDAHDYTQGRIAGMSMSDGDTTLWFANGYMRRMAGSPAENMATPTILEAGPYEVAPGYAPEDVIAVSDYSGVQRRFWYADGTMSYGSGPATAPSYPDLFNADEDRLVGIASASNGRVYSWFNTGARASGTSTDLDAYSSHTTFNAPQHPFSIAAIAIDSGDGDGRVWTVYRDGAVSRGRSWNLGQQTWDSLR